jgi:hypothetical protein
VAANALDLYIRLLHKKVETTFAGTSMAALNINGTIEMENVIWLKEWQLIKSRSSKSSIFKKIV